MIGSNHDTFTIMHISLSMEIASEERCPQVKQGSDTSKQEWGEFLHVPGKFDCNQYEVPLKINVS